ncbi:MAG TPA: VWA domain-containing protein, partial [Longimicrobiales bacterium]|nr:VWA domain-containing protein [Longimicrobiales bacterium]
PRGGRLDLRATLRGSLRGGGYPTRLVWRRRIERPPAVVVLCDISGSMDVYSRMALHFLHRLGSGSSRVFTFLFGTRLTHVTRILRRRDVDEALAVVGRSVEDWAGGTRIGRCLETFNRVWSRRVLGQGAVVLLISDGLDRGDLELLGRQMEHLRKSCRRLIWLNPLLRYREFEPRAGGVRRILPWVDDFRPVHDLESLEGLARALQAGPITGSPGPSPPDVDPASTADSPGPGAPG